jgi:hypothetical protein
MRACSLSSLVVDAFTFRQSLDFKLAIENENVYFMYAQRRKGASGPSSAVTYI